MDVRVIRPVSRDFVTFSRILVPVIAIARRSQGFRLNETAPQKKIENSIRKLTGKDNKFPREGLARSDDGLVSSRRRVREGKQDYVGQTKIGEICQDGVGKLMCFAKKEVSCGVRGGGVDSDVGGRNSRFIGVFKGEVNSKLAC